MASSYDAGCHGSDIQKAVRQLVQTAHKGEPWAVKELLDRYLGKCPIYDAAEVEDRLTTLESVDHSPIELVRLMGVRMMGDAAGADA